MLQRLRAYISQQHLALLALFVAFGGTAYAAATINSADIVNDSLQSADIKGRPAGGGRPFVQGTITGADVKGSPGVNGGLTGFDIANGSITGADISPSTTVPRSANSANSANSARLGGLLANRYGQTTRSSHQDTADCDATNAHNECAKVTVTVPAGRQYRATVESSFSVLADTQTYVWYCAAVKGPALPLTCLTGRSDRISLAANYIESAATSGDTRTLGFDLGEGTWTFSTMLLPRDPLGTRTTANTTVTVTDATAPGLPGVVASSGSSGTCTNTASSSSGTGPPPIPCGD